ncbi:hypothetical protein [Streptomyces sp. WAC06614]|uniref:hypothetical protein n=1 Tax=Streptomyces sp. WAC06614 TaxID=2487416 RepID=UPI000F7AA3C4|nr:hypothetical protein [Streptomyces sp. WAC06614]RSS56140.1 hypothetical protein EF918_34425 [Streptomyces sp. WAC06614]
MSAHLTAFSTALRFVLAAHVRNRLALFLAVAFTPAWLFLTLLCSYHATLHFQVFPAGGCIGADNNQTSQVSSVMNSITVITGFMAFLETLKSGPSNGASTASSSGLWAPGAHRRSLPALPPRSVRPGPGAGRETPAGGAAVVTFTPSAPPTARSQQAAEALHTAAAPPVPQVIGFPSTLSAPHAQELSRLRRPHAIR